MTEAKACSQKYTHYMQVCIQVCSGTSRETQAVTPRACCHQHVIKSFEAVTLQGESTLHSSTPQESSTFTAVAASSSEDSDAVPPSLPAHATASEGTAFPCVVCFHKSALPACAALLQCFDSLMLLHICLCQHVV